MMNITRFDECRAYYPPKHDETVHAMYLQHKDLGCDAPYGVMPPIGWDVPTIYPGQKRKWQPLHSIRFM